MQAKPLKTVQLEVTKAPLPSSPILDRPDNRLYLGKGGSGKTTLLRYHLRPFKRVLVYDTAGEPEWAAWGDVLGDLPALIARLRRGRSFRLVFRGFLDPRLGPASFEQLNRVAWAAEDVVVVWEEADLFTSASYLPPHAYTLIHVGRHRGIRVFATARAPALIARAHSRNVQRIVAFQTTEPRDLAYLGQVIGEEAAARLPGLARFQAVDWRDDGQADLKVAPFE